MGPMAFIINATDLQPLTQNNFMFKYADDFYLAVPASNFFTITAELKHISAWASENNLKLNETKTRQIVFKRKNCKNESVIPVAGVELVNELKILGCTLQSNLRMEAQVQKIVTKCSQTMYALNKLKVYGLKGRPMHTICKSTLLSQITYASLLG